MEKIIETKMCKCGTKFNITDRDIEFFEKVSPIFNGQKYLIPSPTLCPDCRQQRRQSFKNIYNLYKNEEKNFIAAISQDKGYNVVSQNEWWENTDIGLKCGVDYDKSKSFLSQLGELQKVAPRWNLIQIGCENCERSINISGSKNCYLVKSGGDAEDCYFGERVFSSQNTVDGIRVEKTTNCYDSINLANCFNVYFGNTVFDSNNSMYVTNCKNIQDCIGCIGIENKKFYILNKQSTKEEVEKYRKDLLSNSTFRDKFLASYRELIAKFPVKSISIEGSEDCYGNEIYNSKDVYYGFDLRDVHNAKYSFDGSKSKDVMDTNGDDNGVLSYECSSNFEPYNSSFCFNSGMINNCYYCETCINLKNCFGCVGLNNKEYCILNKQYTKEEYNLLVPQIIESMRKNNKWGEFFPINMSPYGYNESEAQEYFPLSKKEALLKGFKWSDYEAPFPKASKTIPASKLPNNIKDVPDDILNWAIECEISKKPFRIIKQELEFYRKHNLPIPRRHPDVRHMDRMKLRNPRKLFDRKCDKCSVEIKTTYAPERPEVVHCEECYSKEIL